MKPQWALIAYLWTCYVLNHADRQVVYTLFPALQSEFGLSDTMLGMTGALFLWVYGFCSPAAGILGADLGLVLAIGIPVSALAALAGFLFARFYAGRSWIDPNPEVNEEQISARMENAPGASIVEHLEQLN